MADVLKMVFKVTDTQTHTLSLKDPKDGLTSAQAQQVAQSIVDKQAIVVKGIPVKGLKTAFIQRIEDVELA